jgi:hypothetical protein
MCKLEPNLVELEERECERSWTGWGCRCRGAMGKEESCVSKFIHPVRHSHIKPQISTAIMERVQFQQEQVRQCLDM